MYGSIHTVDMTLYIYILAYKIAHSTSLFYRFVCVENSPGNTALHVCGERRWNNRTCGSHGHPQRVSVACRVARESMEVEQALWAVARDAAYEALTEPPTREAYEKLIHLNNAELLPNNCIRIVKRIQRGQEILVTFGWDFYERVTPLTLAKMRQQDTRNMSRE